jgi:uncharacterized YigZ family protein
MRVVNSRFIATACPAFSVEKARAFIDRIRDEFADASHNVPAYLIGHGASTIAHCSDDGEPAGTAGPPALAVLRGSGLGDAAVVVTRYFGGTKLGTGGLVRAYGDAVRHVLSVLPRAIKVPTYTISVEIPYSLYDRVLRLTRAHHGQLLDQTFAAQVLLVIRLPQDRLPSMQSALGELSRGRIRASQLGSSESTILPIESATEYPLQ